MKRAERDTLRTILHYAEAGGKEEMLRNLNAIGISEDHINRARAALNEDEWLAAFLWFVGGVTFATDLYLILRSLSAFL